MTPLTPSLTDKTRTDLLHMLTQAGFPEVGQNSVVITLSTALGIKATSNTYVYDQPQPQLPKVTAIAHAASSECANISATAYYDQPKRHIRVRIEGTYCLIGSALWNSSNQTISVETPANINMNDGRNNEK